MVFLDYRKGVASAKRPEKAFYCQCRREETFRSEMTMKSKHLRKTFIVMVACVCSLAPPFTNSAVSAANRWEMNTLAAADLSIIEFVFAVNNDKTLRVHIVNAGAVTSGRCIVRLTVRKINGIPGGRFTEIKLQPLAAGKDRWLLISANSILPGNVSLASTTFKLNADATSLVTESNEANNEVWHNL